MLGITQSFGETLLRVPLRVHLPPAQKPHLGEPAKESLAIEGSAFEDEEVDIAGCARLTVGKRTEHERRLHTGNVKERITEESDRVRGGGDEETKRGPERRGLVGVITYVTSVHGSLDEPEANQTLELSLERRTAQAEYALNLAHVWPGVGAKREISDESRGRRRDS